MRHCAHRGGLHHSRHGARDQAEEAPLQSQARGDRAGGRHGHPYSHLLSPAVADGSGEGGGCGGRFGQGDLRLRLQAHDQPLHRGDRGRGGGHRLGGAGAPGHREAHGGLGAPHRGQRIGSRRGALRSAASGAAPALPAHEPERRAARHPFPAHDARGRRGAAAARLRGAAVFGAVPHAGGRRPQRRVYAPRPRGGRPAACRLRLLASLRTHRRAAAGARRDSFRPGRADGGQPYASGRRGHRQDRRGGPRPGRCRRFRGTGHAPRAHGSARPPAHGGPGRAFGRRRGARRPAHGLHALWRASRYCGRLRLRGGGRAHRHSRAALRRRRAAQPHPGGHRRAAALRRRSTGEASGKGRGARRAVPDGHAHPAYLGARALRQSHLVLHQAPPPRQRAAHDAGALPRAAGRRLRGGPRGARPWRAGLRRLPARGQGRRGA